MRLEHCFARVHYSNMNFTSDSYEFSAREERERFMVTNGNIDYDDTDVDEDTLVFNIYGLTISPWLYEPNE